MVRSEDERAQSLRDMGAEVIASDLLDLADMRIEQSLAVSVSDTYLAATVNAAAVAKHHKVLFGV